MSKVRFGMAGVLCALVLGQPLAAWSEALFDVSGTQLTTQQITATFSDTLDRGEVLDAPGTRAETHWLGNGSFSTRWWRGNEGGKAVGVWQARDGKRCVQLEAFDTLQESVWYCGKVLRRADGRYLSFNPDGTVHGLHELEPLKNKD